MTGSTARFMMMFSTVARGMIEYTGTLATIAFMEGMGIVSSLATKAAIRFWR